MAKTPAWQRKEGKNPAGGLNKKGVASYRAANPGSKLKTAVTTKPSKLKKGSKAANRRKSFCARMSGMKSKLTSSKTANDPNSRINKSLRKWNCGHGGSVSSGCGTKGGSMKGKKMDMGGGLYENIHKKRKRIAAGSGEKMRKPGSKGAPTSANFKAAAKTAKKAKGGSLKPVDKSKNPGLSKLPTSVRNKMGYMKEGGVAAKRTKGQAEKKMSKAQLAAKSLKSKGITPEMLASMAMGRMSGISKAAKTMKKVNRFADRAKLRQKPAVKDLTFKRTSPSKMSSKKNKLKAAKKATITTLAAENVYNKLTNKYKPIKPYTMKEGFKESDKTIKKMKKMKFKGRPKMKEGGLTGVLGKKAMKSGMGAGVIGAMLGKKMKEGGVTAKRTKGMAGSKPKMTFMDATRAIAMKEGEVKRQMSNDLFKSAKKLAAKMKGDNTKPKEKVAKMMDGGAVKAHLGSVHKAAGESVATYQASNSNYKEGQ